MKYYTVYLVENATSMVYFESKTDAETYRNHSPPTAGLTIIPIPVIKNSTQPEPELCDICGTGLVLGFCYNDNCGE